MKPWEIPRAGAARQPRAAAQFEAALSRRGGYFRRFLDATGCSTQIAISSRDIKLNGHRVADLEAFLMMAKLRSLASVLPTLVFLFGEPSKRALCTLFARLSFAGKGGTHGRGEKNQSASAAGLGKISGRDCACKRAHIAKPAPKTPSPRRTKITDQYT